MPIIKSAKKALRTAARRKEENDLTRAKIKSAVKGVKLATSAKKAEATELLQKAYKELDLAAKKNVIHKNKASRLKSRLAKSLDKAEINASPAKKKTTKK
jgi:small subunit ribosomal protein S20